jgi:ABC-type lipoprotein release transport system permease subunit
MQPMQLMSVFTVRAIVIALMGGSFAIIANMISFAMIGKINERVPERERISYFWWGTEVRKRFKKLYPKSRLTLVLDLCVILMVICFLVLLRVWVFN